MENVVPNPSSIYWNSLNRLAYNPRTDRWNLLRPRDENGNLAMSTHLPSEEKAPKYRD